jgi:hypothetical protein
VTSEARATYEEEIRQARENAGAIIQAAQEAASKLAGATPGAGTGVERSVEELEEQVAYLRAFGQATRTQLRSYLEALLGAIETEWGRADPSALPPEATRPPAQRAGRGATAFVGNTAGEITADDADDGVPATSGARSSR